MRVLVVDASVAAKWVLPVEAFQENALRLKDDHVSGAARLCAPNIISTEVCNALWKAVKKGAIKKGNAQEALRNLGDLNLGIYKIDWKRNSDILDVACRLDCAVYDACYVYLSHKIGAQFVTADDALYKKAKGQFEVLHIKDY